MSIQLCIVSMLLIVSRFAFADSCANHPWNHYPPEGTFFQDYYDRPLPNEQWFSVSNDNINLVKKYLIENSYKRIGANEASKYTGKKLKKINGKSYFVVRGLRDSPSAKLGVYWYQNNLMVVSSALGKVVSVEEVPIIVFLAKRPNTIFNFCTGGI